MANAVKYMKRTVILMLTVSVKKTVANAVSKQEAQYCPMLAVTGRGLLSLPTVIVRSTVANTVS